MGARDGGRWDSWEGGRVWIDAVHRDGMPGKVFVRVSDTGPGIPRDKIEPAIHSL